MNKDDAHLLEVLPVRVRGVELQDPVLTLFGDDWSLTFACPWTGEILGRAIAWEDADLEDRVWDLVGADLVVVRQDGPATRFEFSAATLVATPDTDWDPWILELRGRLLVGKSS